MPLGSRSHACMLLEISVAQSLVISDPGGGGCLGAGGVMGMLAGFHAAALYF